MSTFTYEFEELDIGDGQIVNGNVDVVYRVEKDEPDVGFIGGIEYYLCDIEIEQADGSVLNLYDHPALFTRVEKVLYTVKDDRIRDAAKDDFDKYGVDYEII